MVLRPKNYFWYDFWALVPQWHSSWTLGVTRTLTHVRSHTYAHTRTHTHAQTRTHAHTRTHTHTQTCDVTMRYVIHGIRQRLPSHLMPRSVRSLKPITLAQITPQRNIWDDLPLASQSQRNRTTLRVDGAKQAFKNPPRCQETCQWPRIMKPIGAGLSQTDAATFNEP